MIQKKDWFKIKKYKTIPKKLESQVKKLKRDCFSWEEKMTPEKKKEHLDRFCSSGDCIMNFLAFENNRSIGLAIVLRREINFKGEKLALGGIGGVCTHPEKRKRGVASALLKHAVKELKMAHCDIAYLCTNLKSSWTVKLYGKFGFIPLGRPHTYFGKSGKQYEDKDAMIAPVCNRKKFNEVLKDRKPFAIRIGNW